MRLIACLFVCMLFNGNNSDGFISGKGYKGYIFDAESNLLISFENEKERFTPNESVILYIEEQLRKNLKEVNTPRLNQGKGCPIIHKKLRKYLRQYVGYVTNNYDKIIWINLIWSEESFENKLSNSIISVHDGCSHYWSIKINVETGELFDLNINGSS